MMEKSAQVEMIPIDAITVVNPRARNPKVHGEITESIERIGLKRPITVRRVGVEGEQRYALVCGQGRLESCKMLGQSEIAAIIVDTTAQVGHVMSIVENVARRQPRASETLEQVGALRKRGYSDSEIGAKIGCTSSWVNNVTHLLEKGEKRLLAAAEAGHIPLHLAVGISRATEEESQVLLLEAYERGDLKGKKVAVMRRILDLRIRSGKQSTKPAFAKSSGRKGLSPEDLARLYQRDTAKHKLIQKKAEHTQNALLLAQEIFKELLATREFCNVLKAEKLTTFPQPLAELSRKAGFPK